MGTYEREARRGRRAAARGGGARGRQHHAQAQLYRAQLAYESREAEAASLSKQLRDGEMAHRREAAALREASGLVRPHRPWLRVRSTSPPPSPTLPRLLRLLDPATPVHFLCDAGAVEEALAARAASAKAARDAAAHSKEREALITELAAAHARATPTSAP